MKTELKIRVDSLAEIEELLIHLGATLSSELTTEHVYFYQPEGKVLKLVYEKGVQTKLYKLKKQEDQFLFESQQKVVDSDKTHQDLADHFGISKKLHMHAKKYALSNYVFGLYTISNLGKFVIIEGENPSIDIAKETLKIKDPEIVTVSFDKL